MLFFVVAVAAVVVLTIASKMNSATTDQTKRLRFDTTVHTPEDDATTPLDAARKTLMAHCESLQPQIATILSKLGKQHLSSLQRIHTKRQQVSKLEHDNTLIPRSARVKFTLTASKLVESDAEYQRLKEDTEVLIDNFQRELKRKIILCSALEARLVMAKLRTEFATALQVSTKAFAICDPAFNMTQADQIVNTVLERYPNPLLKYIQLTADSSTLCCLPLDYEVSSSSH